MINACLCTAETGPHAKSDVLQSAVWQRSQSQWEEEQQTDIPLPPADKKQAGRLHSSKQIEETATQFFTLFIHSTRSTSGKWTYKGEKRVDNLKSMLVPVTFSIQSMW